VYSQRGEAGRYGLCVRRRRRKHVVQFKVNGFASAGWLHINVEAASKRSEDALGIIPADRWCAPGCRIGLRYVNQLDLPLPIRDFRDFIRLYRRYRRTTSAVGRVLPTSSDSARGSRRHADPQRGDGSSVSPDVASVCSILIVSSRGQTRVGRRNMNVLEALRLRKNLIFEGCITNNTRDLIS